MPLTKANLKRTVTRTLAGCGIVLLTLALWLVRDQIEILIHKISGLL
jgi:hypothetical protein